MTQVLLSMKSRHSLGCRHYNNYDNSWQWSKTCYECFVALDKYCIYWERAATHLRMILSAFPNRCSALSAWCKKICTFPAPGRTMTQDRFCWWNCTGTDVLSGSVLLMELYGYWCPCPKQENSSQKYDKRQNSLSLLTVRTTPTSQTFSNVC